MIVCRSISEIRSSIAASKKPTDTIGLVPTMGFLHNGHMALVEQAKAKASCVIATIYVNPSQFGEATDLDAYPRNESRDLVMLEAAGVDTVLIPDTGDIYPEGDETIVETTRLANTLHGKVRPGHFRGVTTVVARLFNIVQPDFAFFGEKDFQQLQVIKRMVRDLHFPIQIIGVPTVREADGLAMSSRNVRLSEADRAAAVVLSQALTQAAHLAQQETTISAIDDLIRGMINSEPRADLSAVDIVWSDTLEPAQGPLTKPIAIMLSAQFGDVLLIDQREIAP